MKHLTHALLHFILLVPQVTDYDPASVSVLDIDLINYSIKLQLKYGFHSE